MMVVKYPARSRQVQASLRLARCVRENKMAADGGLR